VVVNFQGSVSDCTIGSYQILLKDELVLTQQVAAGIDSSASYFDTIFSQDGSEDLLVHMF